MIPEVSFINQYNQLVTRDDILKEWSLFFFGYASCPEFCSLIVQSMDKIGHAYRGQPLTLYFVSIDPLNDTPEHLRSFLSNYKTPIIGLTGTLDQVHDLAEFFKLTVERADGQERHIEHSASLVLVSPQGHVAGIFSEYRQPKQIAQDIAYAQYYGVS